MNNQQKITQIENLITETKSSLKSWANQISQHHKTLKELTSQVESIKNQLNMNQPNQIKPTKSVK